jgi:PII-like signaling protein
MSELSGEQVLVRIYIGESDKIGSKPLYQALVEMLRKDKISGVTVLRGIMGFGARSRLHTANILRLSQDLPIIIEIVDTAENIDRVLPQIEQTVGDGLITLEKVRVIRYGVKKDSD